MSRQFDGPLTKDDLAWARARLPEVQVERLIALHGTKGKADSPEAQAKAEAKAAEEAEKARLAAEQAAAEAQANEGTSEAEDEDEEDLIGDPDESFDVLGSTEAEVKTWAESASDEDKAQALSAEQGRSDREPRKGVVSLLS